MNDYTTYVGMDVHARSIMCKGMCKETGELYARLFVDGPSSAEVHEWMASLPQPVYSAYESGCTGFWLARELRELGDDCDVIAISTLPRSAKDKQGKCDKLDAKVILREIMNPLSDEMMSAYYAYVALTGADPRCAAYIRYASGHPCACSAVHQNFTTLRPFQLM